MQTKLKLIEVLEQNHNGIHLRGLSRILKTGLPNIIRYVNILEKEKVVERKKEANLIKVKLRKGVKTTAYLKQVNTEKFLNLPKKIQTSVNDFLKEQKEKPLIILIFGSYAKENYIENSDIDILLVYQEVRNAEDIENTAKRISMRTNTKLSPVYLNYKNFEKNFLNKEHDFSNEIRNNIILLNGVELYYEVLWRFLE